MEYKLNEQYEETYLQEQLNQLLKSGSASFVARHLGCNTLDVIIFAKGKADALNETQLNKLQGLLKDLRNDCWQGRPRKSAWYVDGDGKTQYTTTLKTD